MPVPALLFEIDDVAGVALRIEASGRVSFHDLDDGRLLAEEALQSPSGAALTQIAEEAAGNGLFAAGFADGSVLVADWNPVALRLEFPLGSAALPLLDGAAVRSLALRAAPGSVGIAAAGIDGSVVLLERNVGIGPAGLAPAARTGSAGMRREWRFPGLFPEQLLLLQDARWMLLLDQSQELLLVDTRSAPGAEIVDSRTLTGVRLTDLRLLAGGMSLLAADAAGNIGQWLVVRDGDSAHLAQVRRFELFDRPVAVVAAQRNQRNFAALSDAGELVLVNASSAAEHLRRSGVSASAAALAPSGASLALQDGQGAITIWQIDNEFADFSLVALWAPTWHEGYPEPKLIWQSSSADDAFEPKYSLVPLTFGTLKASLYAMLFAAPLALCAAVFTGHFLAAGLRRRIKPLIELMETLPTVVIGFVAGLWLAPLVDANLAAIALAMLLLPGGIVVASLAMAGLPERFGVAPANGWQVLALAPVLLLSGWLAWLFAPLLEAWLLGGSLRDWLEFRWGLDYTSRNALIVGMAMGFAVVPVIYSIADDAVFTVPRRLSLGALALGTSRWQAFARLVLPVAAPGMISALMIGFGRALGETMIVLMATGNTPLIDWSVFTGMRTLAANLAIEIPESEPGSTHYRILFLAALLLLLLTFVLNSAAELVRQRMRKKYRMI